MLPPEKKERKKREKDVIAQRVAPELVILRRIIINTYSFIHIGKCCCKGTNTRRNRQRHKKTS
jgi:hypothetical protein